MSANLGQVGKNAVKIAGKNVGQPWAGRYEMQLKLQVRMSANLRQVTRQVPTQISIRLS